MNDHDRRMTDERLTQIEMKLDKLTTDVEDLVSAWRAGMWLVTIIKWAGGAAVGAVAILTYFRNIK